MYLKMKLYNATSSWDVFNFCNDKFAYFTISEMIWVVRYTYLGVHPAGEDVTPSDFAFRGDAV